MKLEYKGRKWDKEVINFRKFKKEVKGSFNNNEKYSLSQFENTCYKDYLSLYFLLAGDYEALSRYYYLDDINSAKIVLYTYLSGIAGLISKYLYKNGLRSEDQITNDIIENGIREETDFKLFQLISVGAMSSPLLEMEKDNLIMLMYEHKYEQAIPLLEALPDEVDDSREVYYLVPEYLKHIYLAIINGDEKGFNEHLTKRIKKYRRNMVGYSTIIDVASIALIKMAQKEGLQCTVDTIEIPKQFFDEKYLINTNECKLPYYDEFLQQGLLE